MSFTATWMDLEVVFLRFFFFLMWTIFKFFIEFVTILLLFYVLVFCPWGMWNLNSPTRDFTHTSCIGRQSLNPWTTREVPDLEIIIPSEVSQKEKVKYHISHVESKIWYKWTYLQNRNRPKDIENKFMVAKGERRGGIN